jgi:hypothetical protein
MAIIMQHKIHVVLIKYKDGKTVTIMGKYNICITSNKIRHRFQSWALYSQQTGSNDDHNHHQSTEVIIVN